MNKINDDLCICGEFIEKCDICGIEFCPDCDYMDGSGCHHLCEECAWNYNGYDDE